MCTHRPWSSAFNACMRSWVEGPRAIKAFDTRWRWRERDILRASGVELCWDTKWDHGLEVGGNGTGNASAWLKIGCLDIHGTVEVLAGVHVDQYLVHTFSSRSRDDIIMVYCAQWEPPEQKSTRDTTWCNRYEANRITALHHRIGKTGWKDNDDNSCTLVWTKVVTDRHIQPLLFEIVDGWKIKTPDSLKLCK